VGAVSQKSLLQKGLLSSICFVIASGKFKNHKKSEIVNFEDANNAVSIVMSPGILPVHCFKEKKGQVIHTKSC